MIKIGMVGAGHIANTHAACLQRIPEVNIAGIFDTTQEKAADMAERYGANTYHDLDSMLSEVDAVYVCTTPKFHREAAIRAVESGIHVFCEKPLTVTVEDAEAIEEAVNRSDVVFAVI
jgi:predicted dehydrogenase